MPPCGDALSAVRHRVRDLGCEALDAGGPAGAGLVAATAAPLIRLWVPGGADARAIVPSVASG